MQRHHSVVDGVVVEGGRKESLLNRKGDWKGKFYGQTKCWRTFVISFSIELDV